MLPQGPAGLAGHSNSLKLLQGCSQVHGHCQLALNAITESEEHLPISIGHNLHQSASATTNKPIHLVPADTTDNEAHCGNDSYLSML